MTQKGNTLTKEQIAEALKTLLDEAPKYKPKAHKKISALSAEEFSWQFDRAVDELFDLHEALLNDRSVWGSIEHRLKGCTWFTVYYVKDNKREKFWMGEFFPLFYARAQKRHLSLSAWVFQGFGLTDATDYLFTFFKNLGGCYAQIEL